MPVQGNKLYLNVCGFHCELLGFVRSEAFASQPTLERIDLRYNRVSTIDGGSFSGLKAPKEIYLSGNRLVQLNSDVFEVSFF